jgi:DNA-directed RNA polymerase specialized sigma24 family protein
MLQWALILLTAFEVVLLTVVIVLFHRIKRSESVLNALQEKQQHLLNKLDFNAKLEEQLMATFRERQDELVNLADDMERKAEELRALIKQAESISSSPRTKRQAVVNAHRRGMGAREIARAMNLSVDEVELLLMETGSR